MTARRGSTPGMPRRMAQPGGMTNPALSRLGRGGGFPAITVLDQIANARQATLTGRAAAAPSLAQPRQSRRAGRSSLSHRPADGPHVGSQPDSPREAKRGKGNTTAFSASVEIFGPGTKSWADTRTSVVPIDRFGAAPGGRAAKQQSRKRTRLHRKLRQATGETDRGCALSRRGRVAG